MNETDYKLIIGFLMDEPIDEDNLRLAVKAMFDDHGKLLDRVVELGGKEMAREYWEEWANSWPIDSTDDSAKGEK